MRIIRTGLVVPVIVCSILLAASWACRGRAGDSGPAKAGIPSSLRPLSFSQVSFEGEYGARLDAATRHVLTWTDLYTLESFVATTSGVSGGLWYDWPGDQLGRWLSLVHVAQGFGWSTHAWRPSVLADALLHYQTVDGNFGPPGSGAAMDVRMLSGNAFALRGLMDAYGDTRDVRFLDAARRLGRYLVKIVPAWETKRDGFLHEYFGHCLDGLVALSAQGGDRWALEAAETMAAHAGRTPHTHHSLSLCRGLVDLALATGKREYLAKAADYLAWCRENRSVTGGLPESMPVSEQDEGCGLADWIVVNLMMAAATGEDRYIDDAEHTLVNHFFMNQFHTGGFGHLSFAQDIVGGKSWQGWGGRFGSENPGCCSLWGAWALGQAGRFVVTENADTVFVNLYADAAVALPDKGVRLEISGDFPRSSKIRIRVAAGPEKRTFALALRIPAWVDAAEVVCAGELVKAPEQGERVLIRRAWKGETDVEIEFRSRVRLVPWPQEKPVGVGIFDGPICLGLPADAGDVSLPWSVLADASGHPLLDAAGRPIVLDPSGLAISPLEPVSARWLLPDIKDPIRRRVLFSTKRFD
jgi:hypothetical protein